MDKKFLEFSVQVYGDLVPYNDVLSKARVHIFYKNGNRNGTYITDEFGEQLAQTLTYVPIKGIYKEEDEDFSGHGEVTQGRIYGIVPEEKNFAWEPVADGEVVRNYASCDVLLFTGIYKEASQIVGKSLSMELNPKTAEGRFENIDGITYYVFEKGSFLSLQILGDKIEPCFEGAGFFSLNEAFNNLLKDIHEYDSKNRIKGGSLKVRFNGKDEVYQALWDSLNTNYTEEKEWTVDYSIIDVAENNCVVQELESGKCYSCSFTKDEETGKYSFEFNTENEYTINPADSVVEKGKFVELENLVSTLNTEKAESKNNYEALEKKFNELSTQYEELKSFKAQRELEDKNKIIEKYSRKLDNEVIETYKNKINSYSLIDLDKDLAYELVCSDKNLFAEEEVLIPNSENVSGLEAILDKYN